MFKCLNCGLEQIERKGCFSKYCNNRCQAEHKKQVIIEAWLNGGDPGWTGKNRGIKRTVREFLMRTRGTACSKCGWDQKHPIDGSTLTEIDHIDGNAENFAPSNLRILCPNCHAMTPTFRNRNKLSKRSRS